MPVEIQFDESQKFIIYTISDPVNIADLYADYKEEKNFRDSVEHTVHSIVDMSAVKRIPPNWLTAKSGPGLTHPHSGQMLFVGLSTGLRIIVNTITKIMRYEKMQVFNTREEADDYMAYLVQQQETASNGT
ncbi:MAG: hypothetical protein RLP44_15040 [Aggregatilineales bacterium]